MVPPRSQTVFRAPPEWAWRLRAGADARIAGAAVRRTECRPSRPVSASVLPSVPAPVHAGSLTDFTDRWPAMVIKELRQGLRARGFVFPFLLLHLLALGAVAMEFLLTRTGTPPGGWQSAASGAPGLFWMVVYLVVAGVMPLRLMESLRGENDGRNAELLLLGGLTRWQIVRGKWLVQALLTLLALLSLLPYMLVRYFFGGVELLQSLFSFGSVLAASLGMAGCVVGASGYAGLGMRCFVIAAAGVILLLDALFTEVMIANARSAARIQDVFYFGYGYSYAILLHGLYAIIGLQMARGHLKLYVSLYEVNPTRGMMAMLLTAPFMLIAGAIATCGWGGIVVLILLVYAVSAFDRTPPGAEWAAGKKR